MNRREFLRLLVVSATAGLVPGWLSGEPFDVYLTFDDGPFSSKDSHDGATEQALDILQKLSVRATFFLHGRHILPWHGPVMARYINEGHAVGNHLWTQGSNLVKDHPPMTQLALQFLLTEAKIREVMRKGDESAYQKYLQQPRLFRRPGGKNSVNDFLVMTHYSELQHEVGLRAVESDLSWLKRVYDYSGWHVNGGEAIPLKIRPFTPTQRLKFVLYGNNGYYGLMNFLYAGTPPRRSVEAKQGLIVLMHEIDPDTRGMLPDLVSILTDLGAEFRSLPRPGDKPNSTTVGISHGPTMK